MENFDLQALFGQPFTPIFFVTIFKILSPIGAGASALLGFATNFWREGTRRISTPGIVAIVGLTLSALLGMAASAIDRQEEIKSDSLQRLQLVQMERSLSPIGNLRLIINGNVSSDAFPAILNRNKYAITEEKYYEIEKYRKAKINGYEITSFSIILLTAVEKNDLKNIESSQYNFPDQDWGFHLRGLSATANSNEYNLELSAESTGRGVQHGFRSWMDFAGATMLFNCMSPDEICDSMSVAGFTLSDDSNFVLHVDAPTQCRPLKFKNDADSEVSTRILACNVPENEFRTALYSHSKPGSHP